jgi:hypothetical protein
MVCKCTYLVVSPSSDMLPILVFAAGSEGEIAKKNERSISDCFVCDSHHVRHITTRCNRGLRNSWALELCRLILGERADLYLLRTPLTRRTRPECLKHNVHDPLRRKHVPSADSGRPRGLQEAFRGDDNCRYILA